MLAEENMGIAMEMKGSRILNQRGWAEARTKKDTLSMQFPVASNEYGEILSKC